MKRKLCFFAIFCFILPLLISISCAKSGTTLVKTSTTSSNSVITTKTSAAASTGTSKTTSATITATSTGNNTLQTDSELWISMPLYPGASMFQYTPGKPNPADATYSKVEWRYYTTTDSFETVSAFFWEKMAKEGWTETAWFPSSESVGNGIYTMNGGKDIAEIWIDAQVVGTTYITLRRKVK